ncbi:MAG: ATP-binding protein [Gemmobacter sp.]
MAVVVFGVALTHRQALLAELQSEATILHRQASQRADQHDAHLTSLSALAVAGAEERPDLFLDVAATIQRFYPRIEAIDLVPLDSAGVALSTRPTGTGALAGAIGEAARQSTGQPVLLPLPAPAGRYLIVKRSPNSDAARHGLAMQIDMQALLLSDSPFWKRPSVSQAIHLAEVPLPSADAPLPGFQKPLGSTSQPLVFQASITPSLADLLRPAPLAMAAAVASTLYLAAVLGFRQMARARRAEQSARISAQETRLAHASRVNALGEMASGMAHELTQPLTAILSHAQAGRHLAERGDAEGLKASLHTIIAQTRRASGILDRLRSWTRPEPNATGPVSVNAVATNVRHLLQAEADRAGIRLDLRLDPEVRAVQGDAVEIEQVLFNLVRNAMDAVTQSDRRQVTVTTHAAGSYTLIEVADTGPGVSPAIRPRLFEPFVTGKADGTGLGLALCQRLVERMNGTILLDDTAPETIFRVSLPAMGAPGSKVAA